MVSDNSSLMEADQLYFSYRHGPNFCNVIESRSYSFELFTRHVNAEAASDSRTEMIYRERHPPVVDEERIRELAQYDPTVAAKLREWAAEEDVGDVDAENGAAILRLLQDATIPTLWPAEVSILDGSWNRLSIRRGNTVVSLSWYEMPKEYFRISKLLQQIIRLAKGESRPWPAEIESFLETTDWTFAKTYARTWPHHYIVKEHVDGTLFEKAVVHIRQFGYQGWFYKTPITYFQQGEFVYWTMVPPKDNTGWYPVEEETIINRCPIESTYEYRRRYGLLP